MYRPHTRDSAPPGEMVAMLRLRGEFSWLWPVHQWVATTPVSPLNDFYLRWIENAEGGTTNDWVNEEQFYVICKNSNKNSDSISAVNED